MVYNKREQKEGLRMETLRLSHGFGPVIASDTEILVLGSFPSVRSREAAFFYMHPQNRFWKLLSDILGADFLTASPEEKRALLLRFQIGLYDVIETCTVKGSSDASIREVRPADLPGILRGTQVRKILLNGKTAGNLFGRLFPAFPVPSEILPSTSPANAKIAYPALKEAWEKALKE